MNLLQTVSASFSPQTVEHIGSELGADGESMQQGVDALVPLLLSAMPPSLGDSIRGPEIFETLKDSRLTSLIKTAPQTLNASMAETASPFLHLLFGPKLSAVLAEISTRVQLGTSESAKLLEFVATVTMAQLHQQIRAGATRPDLLEQLTHCNASSLSALPNSLRRFAIGDTGSPHNVQAVTHTVRWFRPLLVGAALLGLLYSWRAVDQRTQGPTPRNAKPVSTEQWLAHKPASTDNSNSPPSDARRSAGFRQKVRSPDGSEVEIVAAANGIESKLLLFLQNTETSVDKNRWFQFDALAFRKEATDLDLRKSSAQLVNVAIILKAFPSVRIKIGSHTDNSASVAAGLKRSARRASNVRTALIQLGIAPQRIAAEGYGAMHPTCVVDDSELCRAQNRRVSLRIDKK